MPFFHVVKYAQPNIIKFLADDVNGFLFFVVSFRAGFRKFNLGSVAHNEIRTDGFRNTRIIAIGINAIPETTASVIAF